MGTSLDLKVIAADVWIKFGVDFLWQSRVMRGFRTVARDVTRNLCEGLFVMRATGYTL